MFVEIIFEKTFLLLESLSAKIERENLYPDWLSKAAVVDIN